MKRTQETVQSFLGIADIRNGVIAMQDGRFLKLLELEPVGLFLPVFLHRISAHIALVYNYSAAGATAAAGQNPPYSGHLPRLRR